MYDRTANILTEKFAAGEFPVIEAEMLENGEIIIEITESVRFEVFPVCSGPVQSWRLFEKGSDVHYGRRLADRCVPEHARLRPEGRGWSREQAKSLRVTLL